MSDPSSADPRPAHTPAPGDARRDRAAGALYGLALGDALGMPTQALSYPQIRRLLGTVTGFADAPRENPISSGMPAGSVTDDTDQAVIVAGLLIDGGGRVDPQRLADELLSWEHGMRAKGSLDLLGPSTRAALDAVQRGVPPREAGRTGTTNGAAMRIAPVGVAVPAEPADRLLDRVTDACQVTHDTGLGIAGAAAVAAAVSTAVDGGDLEAAVAAAVAAARAGAGRGHWIAGADIAARIEWSTALVRSADDPDTVPAAVRDLIGTSVASQESVPAAFAVLLLADGDPWRAGLLAANLGGDCDTVGAMAGAVAGALAGASGIPADALATLRRVNGLDLAPVADGLLKLRDAAGHG